MQAMRTQRFSRNRAAAGFTMIELLIAIVILLIGVVAVAQLVPNAIRSDFRNRYDSTALILAQTADGADGGTEPDGGGSACQRGL